MLKLGLAAAAALGTTTAPTAAAGATCDGPEALFVQRTAVLARPEQRPASGRTDASLPGGAQAEAATTGAPPRGPPPPAAAASGASHPYLLASLLLAAAGGACAAAACTLRRGPRARRSQGLGPLGRAIVSAVAEAPRRWSARAGARGPPMPSGRPSLVGEDLPAAPPRGAAERHAGRPQLPTLLRGAPGPSGCRAVPGQPHSKPGAPAQGSPAGKQPPVPIEPGGERDEDWMSFSRSPCGDQESTWDGLVDRRLSSMRALSDTVHSDAATSGQNVLCSDLIVPDGWETIFVLRRLVVEQRPSSFDVENLQGQPLSRVVVDDAPRAARSAGRVELQMLDGRALAWITAGQPSLTPTSLPEIRGPSGAAFRLSRPEDGLAGSGYQLQGAGGLLLLSFCGDFGAKRIDVVEHARGGRRACVVEPCQAGRGGGQRYQAKVGPGVDAALVLCGLVAIDQAESGGNS